MLGSLQDWTLTQALSNVPPGGDGGSAGCTECWAHRDFLGSHSAHGDSTVGKPGALAELGILHWFSAPPYFCLFFFCQAEGSWDSASPPVCGALPRPGMGRVKLSRGSWFWQTLILGTSEHKIIITPFPGKKSPWTCVKLAACWLSHFCSCYVGQPGLLMYWTRSNIPGFSLCKETPGSQPAAPGSLRMNLLTVMAKASCTPLWEGSRRTRQALMEKLQARAHFPGMGDSQQWELWDRGQHRVLRRR